MTPEELATIVGISAEAAEVVREIYDTPFSVDYKGPNDPVTEADRRANDLIVARLSVAFPGVPIVAEESKPESFVGFRSFDRIFFVDPVDGTREFVQRNGEFVVMIGLVEGDRAVAGVIHQPATSLVWAGLVDHGAWQIDANGVRTSIHVTQSSDLAHSSVVSSRSHRTSALERALSTLGAREILAQGSAGLKGARVATGEADAYVAPHYAGQRWDVCAVDALATAAGGRVTDAFGARIDYRAESLTNDLGVVASNGLLHDIIIARLNAARASESGE